MLFSAIDLSDKERKMASGQSCHLYVLGGLYEFV